MPRPVPAITSLLALVIATAACKDAKKEEQLDELAHKATADATVDAAAPIVDEDLRFRLEWPGTGWKMLGRDEAHRLVGDAVAGAIKPPHAFGVVMVEPAPGMTAETLLDLTLESVGVRDLVIEERAPFRIAGTEGVRVVFHGNVDGNAFRYANIVFTHQGHGYQLLGWGPGSFDVTELDALWKGFSLTEGEVKMPQRVSVTQARGPGWRVEDGVFESAVTGLRVKPTGEWTLAVGHELALMNPDAEVGMTSRSGAFLVVIGERIGESTAVAYQESKLAAFDGNVGGMKRDAWQTQLFGEPASFAAGSKQGIELMVTTRLRGEVGLQVLGFYPESLRDVARPSLAEAIGSLGLLAPAEHEALRKALIEAPDATEEVGSDYSIHAGVFRDFANAVVWKRPPGLWKLTGPRAGLDATVRLKLEEIDLGVYGELRVQPTSAADGEAWFRQRFGELTSDPASPTSTVIDGREAWVGELAMTANALAFTGVLATMLHEGKGVSMLLIGPPKTLGGAKEWIAATHQGIGLPKAVAPATVSGQTYEDLRLGVRLDAPAGFSHERRSTTQVSATHHVWTKGARSLQVMGLGFAGLVEDPKFAAETAERTMRSMVTEDRGAAADNSKKQGEFELTWHTWTPLGKPRVDSLVTTVPDGALIMIAEGLEQAEIDAVVGSLRRL